MIDLGAPGNFIHTKVAIENGFKVRRKEKPYPLIVLDGIIIRGERNMVT